MPTLTLAVEATVRPAMRPLTRLVLVVGFALTAGTGVGLFIWADRTEDFWAWTIAAPMTAATMGAGYTGASVGLALALRNGTWPLARPVVLAALVLTSLSLLATMRHSSVFAFDVDGLPRVVAWIWLVVYVALPPLLVAVIAMEQRRDHPPDGSQRLPVAVRAVLAAAAAACVLYALALTLGSDAAADAWPWPIPPLPAEVVGAWLATTGTLLAAAAWPGTRRTALAALVPAAVAVVLVAAAMVRFNGSLDW